MKIEAALTTTDLHAVPEHAQRLEALGYDGIYTFEGPHDPFFPLLLAGEHTERLRAHDGRRDRVRRAAR